MDHKKVLGRQIAAARTLLGMTQGQVAEAANLSVPTLKRMEGSEGEAAGLPNNVLAVVRALEAAGVEFTNGGEPGVKLKRQGPRDEGLHASQLTSENHD